MSGRDTSPILSAADALRRKGREGPRHPASFQTSANKIQPGLTSILVPVFNNLQCLNLLYRSLTAQTMDESVELILIDNHSTEPGMDDFYDSIRMDPRVTIIRNAGNLGFGRA
ncbi:MAG: glycosyltransferase, partial [Magnetococcales bacterium]|nr:glycosyltransferase [Magnetococcales bacterium]